MGVQKNATYKVHNGTDFDEINFKTTASQVKTNGGSDIETQLAERSNESVNGDNGWFKDKKTGVMIQYGVFRTPGINAGSTIQPTLTLATPFTSKFASLTFNVIRCEDASGNSINANIDLPGYTIYTKSTVAIKVKSDVYVPGSVLISWTAIGY